MSCSSSIWRQDLNPRPLKHESSPISTRPGLPPYFPSLVLAAAAAPLSRRLLKTFLMKSRFPQIKKLKSSLF